MMIFLRNDPGRETICRRHDLPGSSSSLGLLTNHKCEERIAELMHPYFIV